jgi:hypothetical protein
MADKTKRTGGLPEAPRGGAALQPLGAATLAGVEGGRYCAPIMESPDPLGVGETSVWGPGVIVVGRDSDPQCF